MIVTNDVELRKTATQLGLSAQTIDDLPVPSEALQRPLAFPDSEGE